MKVYHNIDEFKPVKNVVVTTGTFDGVHTGHRIIISRTLQLAKEIGGESVIITFHPHPQIILHPEEKNIYILNTVEEKIRLLDGLGIHHLIIVPFTPEFASMSYSEFIDNILIRKLHAKKLVIGYDHHFGNQRKGEFRHLSEFGKQFDFEVEKISEQKIGEITVSSTKIRKALLNGDVRAAYNFLGYNYFIKGKVTEGDNIGRKLGFPTANLIIADTNKLIPAPGVYAVKVEYDNKIYSGMLSYGTRPTVNGKKLLIEVNIFNFDKDIYSEFLTVTFIERLRDEIKFSDTDQLKEQLLKDKENSEKILLIKGTSGE